MFLPGEKSKFKGRNYPSWMVNSQIVTAEAPAMSGTTRVVTRKLNQVVKNPPSLATMGVKHNLRSTVQAKLTTRKKRSKAMKIQY